jgi:hypothetical protein
VPVNTPSLAGFSGVTANIESAVRGRIATVSFDCFFGGEGHPDQASLLPAMTSMDWTACQTPPIEPAVSSDG